VAALLLFAAPAGAESVRAEGEGSAPLVGTASPRDAAREAALADAVRSVAEGLAGRATGPRAEQALLEALGPNPARFAQSYRELGQFERPGPAGRELVVRVEARIETNAVAAALSRAGLLAASASAPSAGAGSRLVIEPLPAWPLLHAVQKRLAELGARRVTPERAAPGGVVLALDADRSAGALVQELLASPPPGVAVIPLGERGGVPAIRLEAVAPALRAD
jgi:hypothetical protein